MNYCSLDSILSIVHMKKKMMSIWQEDENLLPVFQTSLFFFLLSRLLEKEALRTQSQSSPAQTLTTIRHLR